MAKEIKVETPQDCSGAVHFNKIVLPSGSEIVVDGHAYITNDWIKTK